MRKYNTDFQDKYNKQLSYIRELYSKEDKLLKNIRAESIFNDRPITINQEEGKLLDILVRISGVKTIIEIGTLYGYSTIWLARALSNDGKIYTIEKDKYNKIVAERNFKLLENNIYNKINLLFGDAEDELNKLINQNIQCDMIFIDADKTNYIKYLKLSEKLLKKGGLIVADNTFLSGAVYSSILPNRVRNSAVKNMKLFNNELADSSKYQSIMINTEEGLSIAVKLF